MEHSAPHHHTETKQVLDRRPRATPHQKASKRAAEDNRGSSQVLIQIAAVRSAVNNVGKIILQDHISHCVADAVRTGDQQVLEDLSAAIDQFVK